MNVPPATRSFLGLVFWLGLSFAAAAVGSVASVNAGSFYAELVRPAWSPPGWLFGPVWSALYLLMGIAAWLVWRNRGKMPVAWPLGLFVVQLVANAAWSWLFFVWREGAWAFAEIVVLWILILATTLAFRKVRPLAGLLLLPYLTWVAFATVLCLVTWRLNPVILG